MAASLLSRPFYNSIPAPSQADVGVNMSREIMLLPEQTASSDSQPAGCVATDRFPLLLLICCHCCCSSRRLLAQDCSPTMEILYRVFCGCLAASIQTHEFVADSCGQGHCESTFLHDTTTKRPLPLGISYKINQSALTGCRKSTAQQQHHRWLPHTTLWTPARGSCRRLPRPW